MTCQSVFQGECSYTFADHHLSLYQLQQSALKECYICVRLWPVASLQEALEAPTYTDEAADTERPVSRYQLSYGSTRSGRSSADSNKNWKLRFSVNRNGFPNIGFYGHSYSFVLQPLASKGRQRIEYGF
jgi:hypothetical protein